MTANIFRKSQPDKSLYRKVMAKDFYGRAATTVGEGADVMEQVAFSTATAGITGTYFSQMKPGKANAQAYDPEARKKLRQLCEALTKDFLL